MPSWTCSLVVIDTVWITVQEKFACLFLKCQQAILQSAVCLNAILSKARRLYLRLPSTTSQNLQEQFYEINIVIKIIKLNTDARHFVTNCICIVVFISVCYLINLVK